MSILKQALESIDFQNREFGETLERYFALIEEKYSSVKEINESEEVKAIEELTFKRTGVRVRFRFDGLDGGYTITPIINGNHIFLDPMFKGYEFSSYDKLTTKLKNYKGKSYIDLKNAKVSGMFSEIVSPIVLGAFSYKYLTPGEMTGVFLHELGHIFNTYVYMDNLATTNQVMACVTTALTDTKGDSKKYEVRLKEIGKLVKGKEDVFVDLAEIDDKNIIVSVVIDRVMDTTRDMVKSSGYTFTSEEALSDNFATKFGYGKELVTGLVKSSKRTGSYEYNSFARCMMLISQGIALTTIAGFTAGSFLVSPLYGLFFLALSAGFLYSTGTAHQDYTYDNLKTRYLRIKEQIIHGIKKEGLSDKEKRTQLETLKTLDTLISEVNSEPMLYNKVVDFLFKKHSKERKLIDLQRDLESLAANSIYAKAAELSLIK